MNAVNKVFEENERSELFKLHFTKMKVVFVKPRRDVEKKEYAMVRMMKVMTMSRRMKKENLLI